MKIRLDADFEHVRFLHRLKPFKLEKQLGLLADHGFEPTADGLSAMERAVSAHMADLPSVGKRGKELHLLIMGDVISV